MKKLFLVSLLMLIMLNLLWAQHSGHEYSTESDSLAEAKNLQEIFSKGKIEGHVRSYLMATINAGKLRDYYTHALGGAVGFTSRPWKGFQIGVKGIFTYKSFSSDLNNPDPKTGKISKWEHELYDITNLNNFNDLDRLEELYLTWRYKKGYISYGKIKVEETPLLNESDGRMKPFAFKGLWVHRQLGQHHKLNLGWISRVSPRSTVEWYSLEEAIGLTNNGHQPDGSHAEYHEQVPSAGILLGNYSIHGEKLRFSAYYWYIHRLIHTQWLELHYRQKAWDLGLQYAIQFPDAYQQNHHYHHRYVQPGEMGQVLSAQLQCENKHAEAQMAFTHAFGTGRFLFPRELGRDHFFTSISRARLEGFGDVDVLTLRGAYDFHIKHFQSSLALQRLWGASPEIHELNKYGLDEFYQINTRLHYEAGGILEGLCLDLLYVYKKNAHHHDAESIFNVSDFHQLNLVTNIYF